MEHHIVLLILFYSFNTAIAQTPENNVNPNQEIQIKSLLRLEKEINQSEIFKNETIRSSEYYDALLQRTKEDQLNAKQYLEDINSQSKIDNLGMIENFSDFPLESNTLILEQIDSGKSILQVAPQEVYSTSSLENYEREQIEITVKAQIQLQTETENRGREGKEDKSVSLLPKEVNPTYFYFENEKQNRLKGPRDYDSRIDILALDTDQKWQRNILVSSQSVGIIVDKRKLQPVGKDTFQININTTLKNRYDVCDEVPFNEQAIIGEGTAFIVSDDTMLTASHVLTLSPSNYVIIFEYQAINQFGEVLNFINKSNVYPIKEIVTKDKNLDIALIRTSRKLDRPVLNPGNSNTVVKVDEIYMLGHPLGLPMKLTMNADITDNKNPQYFYTNLDSFAGNSGSPVLNLTTGNVIGMLVSGLPDFVFNGSCFETNVCADESCFREKVIRVEELTKYFKF